MIEVERDLIVHVFRCVFRSCLLLLLLLLRAAGAVVIIIRRRGGGGGGISSGPTRKKGKMWKEEAKRSKKKGLLPVYGGENKVSFCFFPFIIKASDIASTIIISLSSFSPVADGGSPLSFTRLLLVIRLSSVEATLSPLLPLLSQLGFLILFRVSTRFLNFFAMKLLAWH